MMGVCLCDMVSNDVCLLVSVTWLVMTGVRDWRWVYCYDGCLLVLSDMVSNVQ